MLRWIGSALALLGLVGFVVTATKISAWWQAPGSLRSPITIVLTKGGAEAIARQLARSAIIDHAFWFALAAKITGEARGFKAGEYLFPAGVSPATVADRLDRGDVVIHRVVIPEGLTTAQAIAVVRAAGSLTGTVNAIPGEGHLLPSTYFYVYGDSRQALVDRMVRGMARAVSTLWDGRASGLPLKSPEEAVVLASIVEKETALPAERPLIAQVFYNRLRLGMKLQSDPTVIYALTKGRSALGRSLTHQDMTLASPYNTYAFAGLPPGPIANPGRAALHAVLHPEPTDALYFVANGQGGHSFAISLREHDRDINRWRALVHRQTR